MAEDGLRTTVFAGAAMLALASGLAGHAEADEHSEGAGWPLDAAAGLLTPAFVAFEAEASSPVPLADIGSNSIGAAGADGDGDVEVAAAEAPTAERMPTGAANAASDRAGDPTDGRSGIAILRDGPSYFELGAGVFDLLDEEAQSKRSLGGSVEVRLGDKLWFIGPAAGVVFNADGGVYGYGGIYLDVKLGPLVLTPQAGIGGYHQGDSSDLGGVFQFRVGAGLTYQLGNGWRIGASFAHISNAGIYKDNGGAEELYLIVAVPFTL